ncbi:hypothetical protein TNCV_4416201 [Trichonephila clavipes]|uniref:Uncharacterized protein n=1 Tax=Trichonephila clavipes TaxID=2585209 RepID=A0A8X6VFW3_TRICX|nr:hypothetical protein TNCV_4416201 [Trichonephila clavipes]
MQSGFKIPTDGNERNSTQNRRLTNHLVPLCKLSPRERMNIDVAPFSYSGAFDDRPPILSLGQLTRNTPELAQHTNGRTFEIRHI